MKKILFTISINHSYDGFFPYTIYRRRVANKPCEHVVGISWKRQQAIQISLRLYAEKHQQENTIRRLENLL